MKPQDKKLYDFITENAGNITDKWLRTREEKKGSIYSSDSDQHTEQTLREQNALTIRTISSSLLDDERELEENVENWASIVAESRISSETPIYEVIDAVKKMQDIVHEELADYVHSREQEVEKRDIIRWTGTFNCAFNRLVTSFSKAYYEMTRKQLFSQQQLIQDLSTPIIPVSEAIAVLPLIGELDAVRAEKVLEILPEKCVEAQIEHLFIDLSGMPVVDTMVAHQMFQIISVLDLLGISSTISGIRPEVAQTAIQMGIRFHRGTTFSTLKQALIAKGIKLNNGEAGG